MRLVCLAVAAACGARIVQASGPVPAWTPKTLDALVSIVPPQAPIAHRVAEVSDAFRGAPYVLDPAGEGPDALVDRDPEMPLDRMDCQTLVETVLAIARARGVDEIGAELRAIRYRDGIVSFDHRHHFPEIDWIPANVARGVLRDVTGEVAGLHGTRSASARITRPAWLLALPGNPTQARNAYLRTSPAARAELARLARSAESTEGTIGFVGKAALADPAVLARVPHASVVLIVRPHTSMFGQVGSVQNVSHMGFAIWTDAGLMYRHASSARQRAVIDRPLADYLAAMARTRSFAGIAVFAVEERW